MLNQDQPPATLKRPPKSPFAGFKNLWDFKQRGFLPFYRDLFFDQGDLVFFRLAHLDAIFVGHPDKAREIIVEKQRDFIKGSSYDAVRLFVGNGLLTAQGDDWIAQRRMIKGEFTPDAIRDLHQDMSLAINNMVNFFDEHARNNQPVNIFQSMRLLAMNVVSTTLFGRDFTKSDELNDALEVLLEISAMKSVTPFGTKLYLPTTSNWRFLKARNQIYRITDDFIENQAPMGGREPLIVRLIETAKKHFSGNALKRYLRDQVNTIFLAGHETTANALGWAWALLGHHPEIRKRLEDELDETFTAEPEPTDLVRLKYLRLIVMEVLRLYPPVWVLMRDAEPGATLGNIKIEANTKMVISPYFIHRHPHYWADAESFNPDRFIGFAANPSLANAYLPFSYGSRKCIGDHFAMLELTLALAILGKRYRFTPLSPLPKAEAVLTLRPKTEALMMVSRR